VNDDFLISSPREIQMAKVGYSKNTAVQSIQKRQVKHQYVDAKAFNVEDPITKLIHTIGGGFFNEPKYYSTGKDGSVKTGESNDKNDQGLTEQAKEIIDTMKAVLKTATPEDLLIVANWVRTDLKIRTTPCIMLATAASDPATKPFLKKYVPAIIQRADEIRQTFAAYNHLFNYDAEGKRIKALPHSLAKGLRDAFLKFRESDFLKYDTDDRPTFGDVALMLRERKRLPKPIFEFLVNRKILNEELTPVFALRLKLNAMKTFNAEAMDMAKKSFATWENLISQFGSKKEVWEFLIESGLMKYMAMLRNLRNFEETGISEKHWDIVFNKLTTEQDHKQLPFRFLAARRSVTNQNAISAVDLAIDKSVENIPDMPGDTFIMVDSSGSMDSPVSEKSKMCCRDAGYTLSALLAKKCGRRATIACFGTHLKIVPFSAADSVMNIVKGMEEAGQEVQHSTHAFLALKWLLAEKTGTSRRRTSAWGYDDNALILSPVPEKPKKVDRIIIVSDMCCYGEDNLGELLQRYRMTVNPEVKYYSINMQGHGQSQADPKDKNTLLLSGWSESLFTLMREFEGLKDESGDQNKEIPSIDLLRERFRIA
jgi:hypothetical protein